MPLFVLELPQVIRGGGGKMNIHMKDKLEIHYKDIISIENLFEAWREFVRGKKNKKDVQDFSLNLANNLFELHEELKNKMYKHSSYTAFNISDPKPRSIHKASVRDRLLHHAVYRILYPHFDKKFVDDSYSCRLNKGTHKAMNRFQDVAYRVSQAHTKTIWVLKCDIRKFFASIDQEILIEILKKHIKDEDTIWLLKRVIDSFNSGIEGKGLPLGNLTSQLLVNIYMNEFDQYIKQELRVKYYIRYADDFVLIHQNKQQLINNIQYIERYLNNVLKLELHPNKVFIKTYSSGIDFLGWVHFLTHRVLRTSTKRRMLKKLMSARTTKETMQSYLGLLKHGNTYKLFKNSI